MGEGEGYGDKEGGGEGEERGGKGCMRCGEGRGGRREAGVWGVGCRDGMWVGKGEGCVWLDAIASSYLFRLVCRLLAFFFLLLLPLILSSSSSPTGHIASIYPLLILQTASTSSLHSHPLFSLSFTYALSLKHRSVL